MPVPQQLRRFSLVLLLAFVAVARGPGVARADDVTTAQAQVDHLQTVVAQTTKTLTAGTRRWEQDNKTLVGVQRQLAQTEVRVLAAQLLVDTTNAALRELARRLYMTPSPGHFELAMTQGPSDFADAMQTIGTLDKVSDSRSEIVRRAALEHQQLQVQQRRAAALAQQAADLMRASAQRMRSLQSLAQSVAVQLSAAQSNLVKARQAQAARIAAAAAAAKAQQLFELQAQARAAAVIVVPRVIPTCQGMPIDGQQNGFLDPASLCALWQAPFASLRQPAAQAFDKLSQYHFATLGTPLCVTGGYRTYQEQVALYAEKPTLAAVPGTSEHGWGNAVDLCGGIEIADSPAHQWMQAHAADFGWFHPAWAEPTGSKPEPWHWEFSG